MSKLLHGTIEWYLDDDQGAILTVPVDILLDAEILVGMNPSNKKIFLCKPTNGSGEAWIAESDITFITEEK